MDEAKKLISTVKTRIGEADLDKFDWEMTDRNQGHFDIKMMTFLWFNERVTPLDRTRIQLDLQQVLAKAPIKIKEEYVRANLELDPDKRPREKRKQFSCGQCAIMRASQKTYLTLHRERFRTLAPNVNADELQTLLDDA